MSKNLIIVLVVIFLAWFFLIKSKGKVIGISSKADIKNLSPEDKIYSLENYIKTDPTAQAWKAAIQARAEANNKSFFEQLRQEVIEHLKNLGQ